MASSRQLHRIATNPRAYMEWRTQGKLPQGKVPQSPLIELFKALGPGGLSRIEGVTIDHRLGYTGSRSFQWGLQAQRWVAPDGEVFGSFPAESWRDKRFMKRLFLEDLAECCIKFPDALYQQFPRLRRPAVPGATTTPAGADAEL